MSSTDDLKAYATSAATKAGVPPAILLSVITQENASWNPNPKNNVNKNGSYDFGLTQLNSTYYPEYEGQTPQAQIDKSASILAANYKSKGNWFDATAAYNGSGSAATAYAKSVFGIAGSTYGYAAPDAWTAANTGLPLDPASVGGPNQVVAQSADGSISIMMGGVSDTSPVSGTGGTGTTPVTTTSNSSLGDQISAFASAHGMNWALIIGAILFMLAATFAMMHQQQPVVVKAK